MYRWNRSLALPITLVAIAFGFLISLQAQTQKNVSAAEKISEQRLSQTNVVLENSKEQNALLQSKHADLLKRLDNTRKNVGTDPQLLAQLTELHGYDGTQEMEGPGIEISLDDRKADFLLTTDELASMINTLKFAGAEAISVNGQRIVATTAIVVSGDATTLVNEVPINRPDGIPYELYAIGNQDTLMDYVSQLDGKILKQKGITVSISRKVLRVPSYKGTYSFKNAIPVVAQ